MSYIQRTIEKKILATSKEYACLLLVGPRQTGKTTILEHLMDGTPRSRVTLDNTDERRLAKNDPALFLEMHPAPVLIDEVQYAPELFSYIKIAVDNGAEPGAYWLTGSQSFRLMELAQESLAGRTAILHMSALSQSEMYGDGASLPFTLDLTALQAGSGGRRRDGRHRAAPARRRGRPYATTRRGRGRGRRRTSRSGRECKSTPPPRTPPEGV